MHQLNLVSLSALLSLALTLGAQASPFRAVAYEEAQKTEASSSDSLPDHWTTSTSDYSLATSEGASWEKGKEHHLDLKSGTFVIEANKATTLVTPRCHVSLKPKALAIVKVDERGERVFAVLENLKLTTHKHFVALRFGEEAYISDHEPNHEELVGDSQIGLRQLRVHHVGSGRSIAVMEFSLIQLAEREDLLSKIVHSDHPHNKGIKQKLVKTAAVLNVVTSRHGQYAGAYR